MPRPCAFYGCENNEDNMICHRFPNDKQMTTLWKHELNLKDFSVEMLQKNFTVCNEHFTDADHKLEHRKEHKEKDKIIKNNNDCSSSDNSDSIEIVPPTKKNLALLQATLAAMEDEENKLRPQQQQPTYQLNKTSAMEESTASTKNSEDIFVLEAQESYYEHSKRHLEDYMSIDSPDFIILNAPNNQAHKAQQQQQNAQNTNSAADSDVEILQTEENISNPIINMSNSVNEITAAIALASLDTNEIASKNSNEAVDYPTPTEDELQLPTLEPLGEINDFPEFFTDQEISVEELSNHTTTCSSANLYNATNDFDELERKELLKVIHEQAAHIEKLETTLQNYRTTQKILMGHVNSMQLELQNINTMEGNSHN